MQEEPKERQEGKQQQSKKKEPETTTMEYTEFPMKEGAVLKGEQDENDDDDDDCASKSSSEDGAMSCPLFMQGLPRDFATNPQLAALASLMNNDDEDEESDGENDEKKMLGADSPIVVEQLQPCLGGGKLSSSRKNSRVQRSHRPYSNPKKKKSNKNSADATIGEAQLFLNMWKL